MAGVGHGSARAQPICVLGALLATLLGGCGGGSSSEGPAQHPPPQSVDLEVPGRTVTKLRVGGDVAAFLEERLMSLFDTGSRPQRTLEILQSDGHTLKSYAPPDGWSVVDFAVHPSGDVSAVLTTTKDVRLVRFDRTGSVRSDQSFVDPDAANDPFFDYDGGLRDASALQPPLMHDAARIVPLGENLALVLRTGLNAVVAYRLDLDATSTYRRAWRTLIEPGSSILGIGITSGTFDTFGQLDNHVRVHIDADANGTLAIGVAQVPHSTDTFRAHAEYFGEPIAATVGALLTRVDGADGRRMGTTVIDTQQLAELHGVRATTSGFALVGRVLSEVRPDGTGWNAFTALLTRDGIAGPFSVLDVDRGDVVFDITALPRGGYLALGATGYVQNPSGASISESALPLLVLLNADGSVNRNIGFAAGPRHNQLTTVAALNGQWLLGGMVNGPGTHSGDAHPELIIADGFVREAIDVPVP